MASLINSVEDLKKQLVIASSFDFKKIQPHVKRAERKLLSNVIGKEQYTELLNHAYDEDSDEPIDLVVGLFQEAVAHYALFLALPTLNTLISNNGPLVPTVSENAQADWKDKLDLSRSLVKIYTEGMDEAFKIMEENSSEFSAWKDSKYYTVFKELLIQQTSQFHQYYPIANNRLTFLNLHPFIREVEDQFFIPMLGKCTVDFLKSSPSPSAIFKTAKETAIKACVALTVSKVIGNGSFSFTGTALTYVFEEQPWERKSLLSTEDLNQTKRARQSAGEEYLKELKKIIKANPALFNCYQDAPDNSGKRFIKKKSLLSI